MLSCGTAAAMQAAQLYSLPLRIPQQRLKFTAGSSQSAAASTDASTASPNKLLHDVCKQHGIHLDPSLHLARTQWGMGLCRQYTHQQELPAEQHRPLVSVPLDLVLSCSIPGCSPRPEQLSPDLQQLLHSSAVSQSWELQVAVLLLWALRQPPESRIGSFWQQYKPLLPCSVQDCSSLLVWSDPELQELQDSNLQATAQQWQQTVRQAYQTAVQPYFNSLAASDSSISSSSGERAQVGTSTVTAQPCSLQDWLWAVASVESRAFGAARADAAAVAEASNNSSRSSSTGQHSPQASATAAATAGSPAELTGLVPVLDLANHAIRPQYEHRVDPTTSSFSLFMDGMLAQQQQQQPTAQQFGAAHTLAHSGAQYSCSSATAEHTGQQQHPQQQEQVLITYGSKSNRQLMEQYGFVVPDNPLDRIGFSPELLQDQHGWMSHKAVKAAALQVLQQQQQQHQHQQHAPNVLQSRIDAAVASILQYRGWKNAQQYKATTPESTALCAQITLAHVQQQLRESPTTAAADSAQLQRLADSATSDGARLEGALRYRLEHKLLLQAAADVLGAMVPGGSKQAHGSTMAPKTPVRRPQRVDRPANQEDASHDDGVLKTWQQAYPLPDDAAEGSMADVKRLYRPPRNDAKGIAIACSLIAAWVVLFYHGCWQIKLDDAPDGSSKRSSWFDIVATFFLLEFVNTGLFITTHDAMHGTICYGNRKLNDWLGRIAITLYAYFDYDMLHKKHWEHHNYTGQPGKDPDFHRGNKNLLVWYARFMWEYTTLLQFAKIILASQVLQAVGVPYANLVVYMAAAPLLAAFRLFYFGTYLPHLPPDNSTVMNWQKSHSSDDPVWLTFLKCYNFGLHWEHHRWPYAPWWELPKAKEITRRYMAKQQQQQPVQQVELTKQPAAVAEPAAQYGARVNALIN